MTNENHTAFIAQMRQIAKAWRASTQKDNERDKGILLIWDGQVCGWKNCLRDPEHERPGVIAVDIFGVVYRAEGGDEYHGAKAWIAMAQEENN